MRGDKMADLEVEAPLAKTEEWTEFSDCPCSEDVENSNRGENFSRETNDNASLVDNFGETFSSSLEDLVNTFDEKITKSFCNYDEKVEKFAPVQIRSQEEIMNNCQMWWTLTGNFGSILPIDWSKSYARKLQLPALNLNQNRQNENLEVESTDEEELAKDLDMHSLIISSLQQEPMFTAEQVLEEIDEIMQEQDSPLSDEFSPISEDKSPDIQLKKHSALSSFLYEDKLQALSTVQLNELYIELERMIQENSEVLIQELALRDELEFEKELKNTFISLLLSIQNKRRQHNTEKRRGRLNHGTSEPKYLTTVIPYNPEQGPPNNSTLQVLIKILKAIIEDSPVVPALLTDYILKVLCPT